MENSFEEIYEELKKEYIYQRSKYKNYNNRELYYLLLDNLTKEPTINIISGLRGIGKTTILLHLTEQIKDSIYISLDNPLLKTIDVYRFLKYIIEKKGKRYLFLDEAHSLDSWQNIIKRLNDLYEVKVILSGSSALGLYNLDRRAKIYRLLPLSFREYLVYKGTPIKEEVSWKDNNKSLEFVVENNLEPIYHDYLEKGGFPFSLNVQKETFFKLLYKSIMKSIKEDSVLFAKMSEKKVFGLEKIVVSLALSYPGELSITNLSNKIGLSKEITYELIDILSKMNIIRIIKSYSSSQIRKESKLLFSHPNIRYAITKVLGFEPNKGALREEFLIHHLTIKGFNIFLPKKARKTPDFIAIKGKEKYIFEVGGSSKTSEQIINQKNAYILKDTNLIALALSNWSEKRPKNL